MPHLRSGADVLIVDDDADTSDAISLLLQFKGYNVATADNGASALDYLNRHSASRLIFHAAYEWVGIAKATCQ
jgi:CheY-like chemotaxis protein